MVVATIAASVFAAQDSISPSVAGLYVGEQRVIEGTVSATERDANVVRLTLGSGGSPLTVALVIGLLTPFPAEPEVYYLNKTVRVAGVIESFRGRLQMVVRDPENILVSGASADAAAESGPAIKLQEEYDALRRQMRDLEERMRQLESPEKSAN